MTTHNEITTIFEEQIRPMLEHVIDKVIDNRSEPSVLIQSTTDTWHVEIASTGQFSAIPVTHWRIQTDTWMPRGCGLLATAPPCWEEKPPAVEPVKLSDSRPTTLPPPYVHVTDLDIEQWRPELLTLLRADLHGWIRAASSDGITYVSPDGEHHWWSTIERRGDESGRWSCNSDLSEGLAQVIVPEIEARIAWLLDLTDGGEINLDEESARRIARGRSGKSGRAVGPAHRAG